MHYPFRTEYHYFRKKFLNSLDSFWPSVEFDDEFKTVFKNSFEKKQLSIPAQMSQQAAEWLKDWNQQSESEALFESLRPCSIDPKFGLLFRNGKVIWKSSDKNERERSPKFLKHLIGTKEKIPAAILLHHLHGDNYFHFINRIMSKLYIVERANLDKNIPFLIDEKSANTRFFREAMDLGVFEQRKLAIQKNSNIFQVDKVFLPRPANYQKETIEWVANRFLEKVDVGKGQPIFALRTNKAANGRTFRNQSQVSKLAKSMGYKIVDPGNSHLREQISLFAAAPTIVGAHGAALTNLVFRAGKNTRIIELFSPSMGSPHYYMISKALKFEYESALTLNPKGRAFTATTEVDITDLKRRLEKYPFDDN